MSVLRSVRSAIAKAVRRAVGFITDTLYGAGGHEPVTIVDFEEEFYRGVGVANFTDLITHVRNSNAVMTDGYGLELVTNGSYSNGTTGWTANEGFTVNNGVATVTTTSGSAAAYIQQSFSTVNGKTYILTYNLVARVPAFKVSIDDDSFTSQGDVINANYNDLGQGSIVFTATSSTAYLRFIANTTTAGSSVSFDNVSVREMPVLKWAPHNLLSYSEDLTNGAYIKAGASVTADQATAPDGTATADLLTSSDTTAQHQVQAPTVSFVSGQKYTNTWFVKSGTHDYVQVLFFTTAFGSNAYANFDLSTGATGTVGSAATASITDVGNNWYRLEVTADATTTASTRTALNFISSSTASRNESWDADGTETIYVWGAHVYRSDLGGMVDNPERGDSYVPTALRPTGANLITNGTFDTDTTGWSPLSSASLSVASGALRITNVGANFGKAYQAITVEANKAYVLTFDKIGGTSTDAKVRVGSTAGGTNVLGNTTVLSNGSYTFSFVPTVTTVYVAFVNDGVDGNYNDFDNVVVRESAARPDTARYLPRIGHHVYNGSAWVNEGLLAESEARTNILPNSGEFSTWLNIKVTVTDDAVISPDGTQSASTMVCTTVSGEHYVEYSLTPKDTGTFTDSVYVKADGYKRVFIRPVHVGATEGATQNVEFDVEAGTVLNAPSGTTGTIQDVGNGWYRIAATYTVSGTITGAYGVRIQILDNTGTSNYAGDGTSGVQIYGAQREEASTPSSLIPTSGSSVTRAAETFTIPSANLPWPSPNYIGSELVTNGTFDTDTTGWTGILGATLSVVSGALRVTEDGSDGSTARAHQTITTEVGKVYRVSVDYVGGTGTGTVYINTNTNFGGAIVQNTNLSVGTNTIEFVATATTTYVLLGAGPSAVYNDYDNISIREINPLSVSIAMDGRMTFADTDNPNEVLFYRWFDDIENRIQAFLSTYTTLTGGVYSYMEYQDTADSAVTAGDYYTRDILTPYNMVARYGSTFVNAAHEGVALTADTTPVGLPDLSSTDMTIAHVYMGTIRNFRVWDKDIGDAGLVEATQPSTEPSLSLTFEGTGNGSFIVNDWSE